MRQNKQHGWFLCKNGHSSLTSQLTEIQINKKNKQITIDYIYMGLSTFGITHHIQTC